MLLERIRPTLEASQNADQAAFRANYGVNDHLFTLTIMTELAGAWSIPLWLAFIDFEKAFDSVDRELLWLVPLS